MKSLAFVFIFLSIALLQAKDLPLLDEGRLKILNFPNTSGIPKSIDLKDLTLPGGKVIDATLSFRSSSFEKTNVYIGAKPAKEPIKTATYAGTIKNSENSLVFLNISEDFIIGMINDGENFYTIFNERNEVFIALDKSDYMYKIIKEARERNIYQEDKAEIEFLKGFKIKVNDKVQAYKLLELELAIESTTYFFTLSGKDVAKTEAYIQAMYNLVSFLFEKYIGVKINVPYLKIWTETEKDPYNTDNDPYKLRDVARPYWINNHSDIQRDLAQIITAGGMGGYGFYNALCNKEYGYSFASPFGTYDKIPFSYSYDVYILAHELGHNFNSPHTHNCYFNPMLDTCVVNEGIQDGCLNQDQKPMPSPGSIMSYCNPSRLVFLEPVEKIIKNEAISCGCLDYLDNDYIRLTSPSFETNFNAGSQIRIEWISSNSGPFNLYYSVAGKDAWQSIASDIQDSSYLWNAPDICGEIEIKAEISGSTATSISQTLRINKIDPEGLRAYYPFKGNWEDAQLCHFYNLDKGLSSLTSDRFGAELSALEVKSSSGVYCKNFNASFDEMTIALWVNPAKLDGNTFLAGTNWLENYSFHLLHWGQAGAAFYIDGNNSPAQIWGGTLPINQWSHLAFTFSSDSAVLYVNGAAKSRFTDGKKHSLNKYPSAPLYIGSRGGFEPLTGKLDEIRIYERALKPEEVLALYNEPPVGSEEKLSEELEIYPNPAVGYIKVNSSLSRIYIYDVLGNIVLLIDADATTRIDISKLEPGCYFVKSGTLSDETFKSGRFIVIR